MPDNAVFNPSARQLTQGQPDVYQYIVNFTALAPNAPQTQTFQIDASAQFFWTGLAYQAVQTSGTSTYTQQTNPVPLVTLLLTDGGSSKQLMSAPQYLNTFAGVGGWPARLLHPRLFDRNSAVSVQVNSTDGTTWAILQLVFLGFRVYGA